MGRPDAEPSEQAEYELQPHEYESSQEGAIVQQDEYLAANYDQNNQQQQQPQPFPQQQFQPQQQPQPFPQQQFQPQPAQYPPVKPNQAYPPQQPAPYPPQQPAAYPPQQPGAYPPQPVQFPPKSPPTNQMYANVTPQAMPPQTGYAPSPQAFPQPGYLPPQGMPPPSPHKPGTPAAGIPVMGAGRVDGWRSGLFDFMDDPMNALVTAFFPCLTFGQIAEIVDDGHTTCGTSGMLYGGIAFCIGLPCLLSCGYRTKLRNKFGLPEAPAPDWVTHFLCEWCALCQEYRELQHRGWDPSIGYQGNLARNQNMQPAPVMMAPMNQRMNMA
ncbi:hypothetical protein CCACVL1_03463 [Corchorus capsularis]|uniref:PLAC8 motif-containing protein n=1 Tax=Corchorus capsularis TaxID=210143 RepID=A0A1R3JZ68_COCAP|nr:hypothetical protein CCACVL1_03463 [Corchorus capsularis]